MKTLTKIILIKEDIYLVIGKDYHDSRFEMMIGTENCVDPVASHNWIILCSIEVEKDDWNTIKPVTAPLDMELSNMIKDSKFILEINNEKPP